MALRKSSLRTKDIDNTGLSTKTDIRGPRFITKDGKANVIKKGVSYYDRFSIYHYMLNLPNWKFILYVFGFYTTINFLFACFYFLFCLGHLQGVILGSRWENFEEAYFFSSQTLTTVGYGRISPVGLLTNTIASLEALIGIMALAIITGLLYGRFVKPKAYLRFSKDAVIAPFKDGMALMMRVTPIKNTSLTDVSVQVTCSLLVEEDGKRTYKFYPLLLQFSNINSLYLNWTIVHPIDAESPLYGLVEKDIADADVEIVVYLKAFDEHFSSTVIARTSYTYDEIVFNAKFERMYYDTESGTVLEVDKLNSYQRL